MCVTAVFQEDFIQDCNRISKVNSKTRSMAMREKHGLSSFEPKPDGLDAVSYSVFFDSVFELADEKFGRKGGSK